jgi:large subunit ribosomal protein L3
MKKRVSQIGFFKKLGMSRIFDKKNQSIPVTILEIAPAYVLGLDEKENRAEIAYYPKKRIGQATQKRLKEAKIPPLFAKTLICPVDDKFSLKPGDQLKINQFKVGDKITVVSQSKGKGFSGVIKRHRFSRGPETHGSHHHRSPGSIGSMFPQRVIAGKKMPGHMGSNRVTIKNLVIRDIDEEKKLLVVAGSVAGPNRGKVMVFR